MYKMLTKNAKHVLSTCLPKDWRLTLTEKKKRSLVEDKKKQPAEKIGTCNKKDHSKTQTFEVDDIIHLLLLWWCFTLLYHHLYIHTYIQIYFIFIFLANIYLYDYEAKYFHVFYTNELQLKLWTSWVTWYNSWSGCNCFDIIYE